MECDRPSHRWYPQCHNHSQKLCNVSRSAITQEDFCRAKFPGLHVQITLVVYPSPIHRLARLVIKKYVEKKCFSSFEKSVPDEE